MIKLPEPKDLLFEYRTVELTGDRKALVKISNLRFDRSQGALRCRVFLSIEKTEYYKINQLHNTLSSRSEVHNSDDPNRNIFMKDVSSAVSWMRLLIDAREILLDMLKAADTAIQNSDALLYSIGYEYYTQAKLQGEDGE